MKGTRDVPKADLHMSRIENMLEAGTPDVEGCYRGHSFWMELKSAKRPRFPQTPVRFPTRDEQIEWLQCRVDTGGAASFLLSVNTGNGSGRCVYLVAGWYGHQLHKGLTEEHIGVYSVLTSVRPTALEVIRAACKVKRP